MREDQGLREAIDRSLGEGRQDIPVDELLARGHRALVRRRLLAGAGAALAVAAFVGTTAVAVDGSGPNTSTAPGYAARPSVSSPSSPSSALLTPSVREAQRALNRPLARFDERGRLVVVPQARVVRRLDNPFAGSAPGKSVALELDFRRVRYWFALHQEPDRSGEWSTFTWSGDYDGSFASWVAEQFAVEPSQSFPGGGPDPSPGIPDLDLVRFVGTTERLMALTGVTILRQREHVGQESHLARDFLPANRAGRGRDDPAVRVGGQVAARRIRSAVPTHLARRTGTWHEAFLVPSPGSSREHGKPVAPGVGEVTCAAGGVVWHPLR